MTKRIVTTTKSTGLVRTTSSTAPRVDPEIVREALGADRVASAARATSPSLLSALRRSLVGSIKSSGGRPGLEGAARRQKIPMAEADWESVEEIAATMRQQGVGVTAGQVAGQLLREAIAKVRAGTSYPEQDAAAAVVSVAEDAVHGLARGETALRDETSAGGELDRSTVKARTDFLRRAQAVATKRAA
jgi:hypothetical protein